MHAKKIALEWDRCVPLEMRLNGDLQNLGRGQVQGRFLTVLAPLPLSFSEELAPPGCCRMCCTVSRRRGNAKQFLLTVWLSTANSGFLRQKDELADLSADTLICLSTYFAR